MARVTVKVTRVVGSRWLHFLLIEDNPADVFPVREAIRHADVNADVRVVVDGEQAIRMLDNFHFRPDLILLDLNLPKFHGLQFLQRRKERSGPPVIVISSSTRPEDREQSLALGALDYIRKPGTFSGFMGTVGGAVWAASHSGIGRLM